MTCERGRVPNPGFRDGNVPNATRKGVPETPILYTSPKFRRLQIGLSEPVRGTTTPCADFARLTGAVFVEAFKFARFSFEKNRNLARTPIPARRAVSGSISTEIIPNTDLAEYMSQHFELAA